MNKCWALSLNNCEGKLTKEHIVSESLLDEKMLVQGFYWCKDKPIELHKSSLKSHILCKKHNEALSDFDSEGKNFKTIITQFNNKEKYFLKPGFGYRNKDLPFNYHINGIKLERWFCKTLINIVVANKDGCIGDFNKILPYIFTHKKFEKPYGLYTDCTIGRSIKNEFLQVLPVFKKNNELSGAIFVFQGIHFRLQLPCTEQIECLDDSKFVNDFNIEGNIIRKQLNWHNEHINAETDRKITQRIIFRWNKI